MSSAIKWLLVAATAFSLANCQLLPAVGTCSQQEVTSFVTQLPNGEQCKSAIETILAPGRSSSRILSALGTFCTRVCGEAYGEFTSENCGDIQYTFRLIVYCLPVPTFPNHRNRCRFAFPDLLGHNVIDSLQNCMDFNPMAPSCSSACQTAIQAFTNGTQCCYQNLYNSTTVDPEVLKGLISNGFINETQGELIVNVTHPALWRACGVPLTTFCSGEYFVGPQPLISGVCTQDKLDNFTKTLSPSCQSSYSVAKRTTVSTQEAEDAFDVICTADCGRKITRFQQDICLDSFDSFLTNVSCHETEGILGGHCTFAIGQHLRNAPFFLSAQRFCTSVFNSSAGTCPPMCAAALREVSRQLGCCYQTIYNNTRARDLLLVNQDIVFSEWILFRMLANVEIWNTCEVPIIEACRGDPFASYASMILPSTVAILCTMIISLLL